MMIHTWANRLLLQLLTEQGHACESLGAVCPIFKREELQFKTSGTVLNNEGLIVVSNEEINVKIF